MFSSYVNLSKVYYLLGEAFCLTVSKKISLANAIGNIALLFEFQFIANGL